MEVTFEDEAVEHIVASFDASIDDEGFIVDDDGNRVPTPEGEQIKAEDLALVEHGSTLYVEDNFASLVNHAERQR